MITYMNPDMEKPTGELRLFLKDKIIDVVPRLGRSIIFESTKLEHEVRPTKNYERFAITSWFHAVPPKLEHP